MSAFCINVHIVQVRYYNYLKLFISLSVFILIASTSTLVMAKSDLRFALVIGNSQYTHASKLKNPKNDSIDMAKTLRGLYFDTTLILDASKETIKKSIGTLLSKLKKDGGVGLFYYAGHGVQFEGSNYLLPIETKVGSEIDIMKQSVNITSLLNGMRKIDSATNIIILDACRDNPFKNVTRSGTRSASSKKSRSLVRIIPSLNSGLSKLDAPSNTIIAYATAPGKVALDGVGRNSPYTAKLIESMQRPGLTIGEVFRQVRSSVVKQTNGQQIPWESSSLLNDFYFKYRSLIPMGF